MARLVVLQPCPVEADRAPDGEHVGVEQREMGERRGQFPPREQWRPHDGQRSFLVADPAGPARRPVQPEWTPG